VSTAARAAFGLLVCATLAAFLVTQRLKHAPNAVQGFRLTPSFSPASAHGRRRERVSFRIARTDDVTVSVLNSTDQAVATLARSTHLRAYHRLSLSWDGRSDSGMPAPPGTYRLRVTLRRQRRSVPAPRAFVLAPVPASG
jgi:hypothetical protein